MSRRFDLVTLVEVESHTQGGRLAALRMQKEGPDDLFSLKPLYARPSQAEAKLEVDLGL